MGHSKSSEEELLVAVGGGAAGIYGAIRAKTVAPNLNVLVIEKGQLLSKVFSGFFLKIKIPKLVKYAKFQLLNCYCLLAGKNFWGRKVQCHKWPLC